MQNTVAKLRWEGWKVSVQHFRVPKSAIDDDGEPICMLPHYDQRLVHDLSPKGGLTIVDVVAPDGRKSSDQATCGMRDSFNRKLGVTIALGRALKKIKKSA